MLPYASYLRVYEPLTALAEAVRSSLAHDVDRVVDPSTTLAGEQAAVLQRTVASPAIGIDVERAYAPYVLRLGGRSFYCPADMPLRSWLSLTSLIENLGDINVQLLFPPESIAVADENFLSWRRMHPEAVPHVRQATWGVPRVWFLLMHADEREVYDAGGFASIRYRAQLADARRRLLVGAEVLERVIDDDDIQAQLSDLGQWLEAFDEASWVELDYAGVAQYLGDVASDESAADVEHAVSALRRGDWPSAGEAYRTFESRWRAVSAHERAN